MNRKAVLTVAVLSFAFPLSAAALKGELISESAVRFQELTVELVGQGGGALVDRTGVAPDGRFDLPHLAEGHYHLRVTNVRGDIVHQEPVRVSNHDAPLQIRLRGVSSGAAPNGRISLRRLSHKPSKEARKALEASAKAIEKGDHGTAIAALERTVAIDPEYFDAQAILGNERLKTGDPEGAIAAYDHALEIDPSCVALMVNRGIALLHSKRLEEAETVARKALLLDGSSPQAHYVLGLSLAQQGEISEETLEHLNAAADKFPQARKAAEFLSSRLKSPK
ncbi:MAG: tetratricopeptide repeat protein [Bryobacteraceae bacterium]|nr:tetratricopeptide repeat protein [Bryobacteraceae bacterium]